MPEGLVVTPQQLAADAGAGALRSGGSAVDAAIAAAFALCVVDAANCGVGGYGGFLLYAPPGGPPTAVEFDTWVPRRFPDGRLRVPGAIDPAATEVGGAAVAPPAVVPGLVAAHGRFGRLPFETLLEPAVQLARGGFPIGRSLAWVLSEHWSRTGGAVGDDAFRAVFYPDAGPPREGEELVQSDLALTLETIGRMGDDALRRGPLADAICTTARVEGGVLDADALVADHVLVREPETVAFGPATVYAPSRDVSGSGVLFAALEAIELDRLRESGGATYVAELGRALGLAWRGRVDAARSALASPHTTHLSAVDADGGLVSLTFTHGPWFGSRRVPPGTGIVLNAGANLFAPTAVGGRAVTNMSPLVVDMPGGIRHALGGTGGPRIPGVLFTTLVELVHYGTTLANAIAAPHVSVDASDGRIEAEGGLLARAGSEARAIVAGDFGPANGITISSAGSTPAPDPRFEAGVARP